MRWDGLLDVERIGVSDTAACGDVSEVAQGALPLRPAHLEGLGALEDEPRQGPVQGKPERAEGSLAPAAWVEKPEMQPRGCG
jgi:hypothetical protein